tara:strand:- start:682 stop:1257 length:576 start_codon:yes stop_codon:yes gene_type:complete
MAIPLVVAGAARLVPVVVKGVRYLLSQGAKNKVKQAVKTKGKDAAAKIARASDRTGKIAKTVVGKGTKNKGGIAQRNKKGQLSQVSKKDQNIASGIRTGGTVAAGTGAAVAAGMAGGRKENTAAAKPPAKAAKSKFGVGNSKMITHNGKPMANVSREQLDATGLSLRAYMNSWNNTGNRPTKNTKKKSAAT